MIGAARALVIYGVDRISPNLSDAAICFGICYVLSTLTLTATQMAEAIVALVIVYSATTFWYIRTTL